MQEVLQQHFDEYLTDIILQYVYRFEHENKFKKILKDIIAQADRFEFRKMVKRVAEDNNIYTLEHDGLKSKSNVYGDISFRQFN